MVLKSTSIVCGLSGRTSGLQRRLIDLRQTREFPEYCRTLQEATSGDRSVEGQLLAKGRVATAQIDRIQTDVAAMLEVFGEMAKAYTNDEVAVLRREKRLTGSILDKITRNVMAIAAVSFRNHPQVNRLPNARELANTFIFRCSLCAYLLLLDWIGQGSPSPVNLEKMRNDLIDANFAAFGTYFDGLLSADRKLNRIYDRAVSILWEIAAFYRRQNC